ncbi:MAG: hypothetical protein C4345_07180 [Chloroflexota bacterium]
MVMGHSRVGPNTVTFTIPSTPAVTHTILRAEFPTDVVRVQVASPVDIPNNATNNFTLTVRKRDNTFNVTRDIASVTNNGTAWTAGVPQMPAVSTNVDATNYTQSAGYALPQPFRKLRPGDDLQVVVTTAGASPPNVQLMVSISYMESAQQSGAGTY